MQEKAMRTAGPATQPNCAIAHAKDSTPEPITAVMIWALAVSHVPLKKKEEADKLCQKTKTRRQ
jgi:hypothetical protein